MIGKTPAMARYLGEKQSPVVLPAAVLAQDVGVFIHQALLIINGSLLLIAQHCIEFPQNLEHNNLDLRIELRLGDWANSCRATDSVVNIVWVNVN